MYINNSTLCYVCDVEFTPRNTCIRYNSNAVQHNVVINKNINEGQSDACGQKVTLESIAGNIGTMTCRVKMDTNVNDGQKGKWDNEISPRRYMVVKFHMEIQ